MCFEQSAKPECDFCGICGKKNLDFSEYDFENYGYEEDIW